MEIIIKKEVFDTLDLKIGIITSKGIDNKIEEKRILTLLLEIENMIKMDFIPEQLSKHELISPWKSAYHDFEERPKTVHSSVERLMKKIFEGGSVKEKNKVIDLINYLSLKHIIPIIALNSGKINGEMSVKKAIGREMFNLKGELKHPKKGEIILMNGIDVLSKNWGLENSDKTKVKEDTKELITVVFGLKPITENKLIEVCKDIVDSLNSFCGGESKYHILNKNNPKVDV